MLQILFLSAFMSLIGAALLIRFNALHSRFSADRDLTGVQKFHFKPVPRIGGVAILLGVSAGLAYLSWSQKQAEVWLWLMATLPIFLAGLLEDLGAKVSPLVRLFASFLSAGLGLFLLEAILPRVDIVLVDWLLMEYGALALLFTLFMVGGVTQAMNIIDGYNGLSGVVAIFIFLALGYVAFKVHDSILLGICLAMVGGIVGFLFLNFPRGLIFAGDGGAYLLGFVIAEVSIVLVYRHSEVSPWFPLLCAVYPVFETVFSIYRKRFLRRMSPGVPDGLHLHMLVYRRLVRWMIGSKGGAHLVMRNSMTSPYLWVLASSSVMPAMLFWQNTPVLMGFCFLFACCYIYIYQRIVRFKTPRWLIWQRHYSGTFSSDRRVWY